ncbi:putative cytochrome P450 [Truncatella angustata]|uniref:Cytochrome P450 n=1 Tax=Truncatella angustata TaxID=152316 RepID=A0A9P8RFG9_9PEZI|nr:putative cytochrome P450 [Truncatella angustata]KAH6645048.1 putative cytochrome P450 [Truncatella angustata]
MGYLCFVQSSAALSAAILVGCICIIYLAGLLYYRLYLSPLAKFPGPKIAAASKWYEFYYDVIRRGQFTFQIQKMHREYGPIVRINPHELHIEDSNYWDELYTRSKEFERYEWMLGRFGANTTTSSTAKSDLHAIRRAPLNPMFSKRSITKVEPVVQEKVEILSKCIATAKENADVLVLSNAFNAFAGDDNFHLAYEAVRKFAHVALHFPASYIIMGLCPTWLVKRVAPNIHRMLLLQQDLRGKIEEIVKTNNDKIQIKSRHPTIFDALLKSDLPSQEKTTRRLGAEAQQMIGAGLETVAWALTTTVYYLLENSLTLERLRAELQEAIPDATAIPTSVHLEQLPYLSACIKEGIRLSSGVSVRLPRISPNAPMRYKGWEIPTGTPVSMTTTDVLYDEKVFPQPRSFVPERWLGNPKTAEGDSLNHYFVPFGKGPRACIGINLAYVELHLALATLFRRFTFELYGTDRSDVEMVHDFFVPSPKLNSKGLRVKVISAL